MNSMGVCRSDTPIEQNVKKNIEKKYQIISFLNFREKISRTISLGGGSFWLVNVLPPIEAGYFLQNQVKLLEKMSLIKF